MSLLDQINSEIQDRPEYDPVRRMMIRAKERAYLLQTQEGMKRDEALQVALQSVQGEFQGQQTSKDYIRDTYYPNDNKLTEDQVAHILTGYEGFSRKEKVSIVLQKYRGRVDPSMVRRLA